MASSPGLYSRRPRGYPSPVPAATLPVVGTATRREPRRGDGNKAPGDGFEPGAGRPHARPQPSPGEEQAAEQHREDDEREADVCAVELAREGVDGERDPRHWRRDK